MSENADSATVRGYTLAVNEREMIDLHWALYLAYGNEWSGWEKLRLACGDRWPFVVKHSGAAGQLSEHPGGLAAQHSDARANPKDHHVRDRREV